MPFSVGLIIAEVGGGGGGPRPAEGASELPEQKIPLNSIRKFKFRKSRLFPAEGASERAPPP